MDEDLPTSPEPTPLRFGILGAARIAPKALIDPASKLDGVTITRVAARDRERAEAFAAEHGIAAVAADYREVIEADDVDIVYNPLPMSLHAEWTIAALRAGKHVLCEKPLASNAAEAAEMVATADAEGRILGEAFHYRYHPLFERIVAEVRSGRIGSIERVEATFDVPVPQPDLRWDYETSGGSLMDLGCYPVSWVRHLTGEEPEVAEAHAVVGPPRIDARMRAELRFASGATAAVACALDRGPTVTLDVAGTDGRIAVVNPLAPQQGNRVAITTPTGTTAATIDAGSTYEHMLRAFCDHVVHGAPYPTAGADSIANMAAIDAIYDASGLGRRGLG